MHANVSTQNSWRVPPDETLQVKDKRSKDPDDEVCFNLLFFIIEIKKVQYRRALFNTSALS